MEAKRDNNAVTGLLAVSEDDESTPVVIWADPDTHQMLVKTTAAVAHEYTEGDTDASIAGIALMWEDTGDTLRAVSAAKPLPVELVTGDIEIGAVEIKNATDDTRATVGANGLYVDVRACASHAVTNAGTFAVQQTVTSPLAYGTDATGADTYVTVVTASSAKTHIYILLGGSNDAIVSVDSGTTDAIYVPANSGLLLDDINIANGATVQAKNASAGNNYTNIRITIW